MKIKFLCIISLILTLSCAFLSCAGEKGEKGDKGDDGITPSIQISEDGYWVINGEKTEHKAIGEDGKNGTDSIAPTVEISPDGYWVINGEKTEHKAIGEDGNDAEPNDKNTQCLDFFPLDDGTYAVGVGNAKYLSKIIIPESFNGIKTTRIVEYGFASCKALTSITLPTSIKIIGESAFADCLSLSSIIVPEGVTYIGKNAFETIENVYYLGTMESWLALDQKLSINAYFYSETQPEIDARYWHYVDGIPTKWETSFDYLTSDLSLYVDFPQSKYKSFTITINSADIDNVENLDPLIEHEIWNYYLENAIIKIYPSLMIEKYYNEYFEAVTNAFISSDGIILDQYTGDNVHCETLDDFAFIYFGVEYSSFTSWREYLVSVAEELAKQRLVMYYVLRNENLLPAGEELNSKIEDLKQEMLEMYISSSGVDINSLTPEEHEAFVAECEQRLSETLTYEYYLEQVCYNTLLAEAKNYATVIIK